MKKIIALVLLLSCFLCYSQTSLDIIKSVNENTYKSLKEPVTEERDFNDLKKDLSNFEKGAEELRYIISNQFEEYDNSKHATDVYSNKRIVDLEIEVAKLKREISDLEYGISKRDAEILPLKVRYNLCSKIIYYTMVMGYSDKQMEIFFSKEELAMCKDLLKEWKRRYQ